MILKYFLLVDKDNKHLRKGCRVWGLIVLLIGRIVAAELFDDLPIYSVILVNTYLHVSELSWAVLTG